MKRFLFTFAILGLAGAAWGLDDDVDGWIRDLGSADEGTREKAAQKLEEAGDRAREALQKASKSDDAQVAYQAERLLDRIGNPPPKRRDPQEPQPAPRRPGRVVRSSSMRIILGRDGHSTSVQQDSDGHVIVKETADGKTEEYKADSRAEFKEKYPEVAKRVGLDEDEEDLGLGQEEEAVQKQLDEARRRMEELLKRRRMDPDELKKALEEQKKKDEQQQDDDRTVLGVEVGPVDEALRDQLDLPENGVLVNAVKKSSRAEKLGIQKYDILLTVNGKPVSAAADIRAALQAEGPLTAEVVREGERQVLREKE